MELEKLIERLKTNEKLYKLTIEKVEGCWILAQALKRFLGEGELYSVVDDGVIKHVVLMVRDQFISGYGVNDASAYLAELRKSKRKYKDPHFRSFKMEDLSKVPSEDIVQKVLDYLKTPVPAKETPKPTPKPSKKAIVIPPRKKKK
jgi:Glu-tRNA(Gln) amidotransferase subunit E-like FAD-binding protein